MPSTSLNGQVTGSQRRAIFYRAGKYFRHRQFNAAIERLGDQLPHHRLSCVRCRMAPLVEIGAHILLSGALQFAS